MSYSSILSQFNAEFFNKEVRSFMGYRVLFYHSSIKHAFYECPDYCKYRKASTKIFSHCRITKENCPHTNIAEDIVKEIPTIRRLIERNIVGKIRVYRKDTGDHVYIYGDYEPYFVVVCRYNKKKNEYIFITANFLNEKRFRKDLLNYELIEELD